AHSLERAISRTAIPRRRTPKGAAHGIGAQDRANATTAAQRRLAQHSHMGYPRAFTVDPEQPGFYHCISRCVRRAWLCGEDPVSGRCFDHRRNWIEQRLISLADSFAVGLFAWAVMSNHTHVVLRIDPKLPERWSDEDVARRWARLNQRLEAVEPAHVEARVRQLVAQPQRIAELRVRLGSLSWFMRFLNESIARAANAEEHCTGRFWVGRFKCQALLDDAAVTACMAYVDLNPVRAGFADDLDGSDFTTIQRRLRALRAAPERADTPLEALAGIRSGVAPALTQQAYVALVDGTGRIARPGKRGAISKGAVRALDAIRGSPSWWATCAQHMEQAFSTAVGLPTTLKQHAELTGRRSLRGTHVS
ncbi:MAG: hypothetical protein MK142_02620, partial [Pseudomonadales bacterium]|nr:hypothetical protein [Pseudomonadales bacterium]